MINIETLTCARCGDRFDRERRRGVKPKNCPACTQALADEARTEQTETKTQSLHCERCNKDWTRPAQRGKPPKRCPECASPKPSKSVSVAPTPVSDPMATQTVNHPQSTTQYSLDRLQEEYSQIPTEEVYKFTYIQGELEKMVNNTDPKREQALKRVWATLEGGLR